MPLTSPALSAISLSTVFTLKPPHPQEKPKALGILDFFLGILNLDLGILDFSQKKENPRTPKKKEKQKILGSLDFSLRNSRILTPKRLVRHLAKSLFYFLFR